MRAAWLILVVTLIAPPARAAETNTTGEPLFIPPPYQLLRFDENYRYLTNPTAHTDWFDPLKCIRLRREDSSYYVTFGGEVRERFEGVHAPNFGIGFGPDAYLLQRLTFLGDLHLGERVSFFAEGISGVMVGEEQRAPPVQDDPIDLAYAFVDVVPCLTTDATLTLRAGRFGMTFGSGRLVATRAAPSAPNIPFRFDGCEVICSDRDWTATGFLTRPAKDSGHFDGSNPNTAFWGLYFTRWLDAPHQSGLDLYYLGINNTPGHYASGVADENRHSLGIRFFGRKDHWEWNLEDVLQVGRFGDQSILAWTASTAVRYTFDAKWQPQLAVRFDVASGSPGLHDGQQGTFDPLFPNPQYFNDASLIRPSNLIDVHPYATAHFTQSLSVIGGVDVFWRYSTSDAIYAPSGNIAIPAAETRPAYVATALDVNLQWNLQRHLVFNASCVHFFVGSYVQAAGGSDVNFVSTTLTFTF
jgi:hypothetical protein